MVLVLQLELRNLSLVRRNLSLVLRNLRLVLVLHLVADELHAVEVARVFTRVGAVDARVAQRLRAIPSQQPCQSAEKQHTVRGMGKCLDLRFPRY